MDELFLQPQPSPPERSRPPYIGPEEPLISQGHALERVQKTAPVIGQHLGILDSLAGPVLVPARDVELGALEGNELVTQAFPDKDGPVVLVDNGFLILQESGQRLRVDQVVEKG